MVPATLDHVQEPGDIALHIGMRVDDGVTHACLRRHMHDALKLLRAEEFLHRCAVCDIRLHEPEACVGPQELEARPFECRIIVGVEVIEPATLLAAFEQPPCRVESDEAGGAGDQQFHNLRHTVLPPDALSSSARICSCAAISSSSALITRMRAAAPIRAGAAWRARLRAASDPALKVRLACPPVMARYTSARMRASSKAPW